MQRWKMSREPASTFWPLRGFYLLSVIAVRSLRMSRILQHIVAQNSGVTHPIFRREGLPVQEQLLVAGAWWHQSLR